MELDWQAVIGTVAVLGLIWKVGRDNRAESERAHDAIGKRIDDLGRRVDRNGERIARLYHLLVHSFAPRKDER